MPFHQCHIVNGSIQLGGQATKLRCSTVDLEQVTTYQVRVASLFNHSKFNDNMNAYGYALCRGTSKEIFYASSNTTDRDSRACWQRAR
ncbi:hypothetical protein CVT25_000143 [Psilocybe cyanescens]|uniref:Uncharacterized protein n=1 Tax=Psilocybe cyanescens TaxID=93625 RepID=A0A409VVR1_PSICY|nr:hypothetical protein CVT25_000143 [Psilocybe cyanescens]